MEIEVGYELRFRCPQPTPMVVMLNIHDSRASDIIAPDRVTPSPSVPVTTYRDAFGNLCSLVVAPQGEMRLTSNAVVADSGKPDPSMPWLEQRPVEELPKDALLFLLGSRYCETDVLSETAWQLFGNTPAGWRRVQAICDSSTGTSRSATACRARPRPRRRPSRTVRACAATSRTSR